MGKPGGIFECENCGTEYSTAWAKEKIQEITGKVQVEGTVEVTGRVQLDASAQKEALLKRGFLLLEDEAWEDAEDIFENVLDIDPECAEAYLGKLMKELHVCKREQLKDQPQIFDKNNTYVKIIRFADEKLKTELNEANTCIRNTWREKRKLLIEEKNGIEKLGLINEQAKARIEKIDYQLKVIDYIIENGTINTEPIEVGKLYLGTVAEIYFFGADIQLTPSRKGLLHISRVSNKRVNKVEDVLNIGDYVLVWVIEIDPKTNSIALDGRGV